MSTDNTIGAGVWLCLTCGFETADGSKVCPRDGAALVPQIVSRIVGRTVDSRYLIQSILGLGGVTVVYKALDTALNRPVIIKMLHVEFVDDPQKLQRFQRGARAASVLSHPNVLTLHDCVLSESGSCYLAMDFVEGTTLAAEIGYRGAVGIERGIRIFAQVCDALAHAHERKIVHRNLKPSNILLTKDGSGNEKAILADFGIAKQLVGEGQTAQKVTSTGQWVGSPLYMSPEQAQGKEVDARSDLFSLGKVMMEAFRGKLPILADSILGGSDQNRSSSSSHPEYSDPVPAPLKEIIDKCLQKEPKERYQSAKELKRHLERLLGKKKGSGLSLSITSGLWWNRIGAVPKIGAAVLVLSVAAVGVFAWLNSSLSGKIELTRLTLMQQELVGHASDPKLFEKYVSLGDLYMQAKKFSDAKSCYMRAEMIQSSDPKVDAVTRMELLSKLVTACLQGNNQTAAEAAAKKAFQLFSFERRSLFRTISLSKSRKMADIRLQIAKSVYGDASAEYQQSLLLASGVAIDDERYEDARRLLEELVYAERFKKSSKGADYILWAGIDLGAVYGYLGRWKLAEDLLEKSASEASIRYLGANIYSISALSKLGSVYLAERRYDESVSVLNQALKMSDEFGSAEQRRIIIPALVAAYRAKRDFEPCRRLLRQQLQALEAGQARGSPEWVSLMSMLASVYIEQRQLQKASSLLQSIESCAGKSKQLSFEEKYNCSILWINLFMAQGNYDMALGRLQSLESQLRASANTRPQHLSEVLVKLAICYAANGSMADADLTFRKAIEIDCSVPALTRSRLSGDSDFYVQYLRQSGRNQEAAERRKETARILSGNS